MYRKKLGFSLISLAFCLGFAFDAHAAPSVRVLGSGAGYSGGTKTSTATSAKPVSTGNTISTSTLASKPGTSKSASIKSFSPKTTTVAPVARTSSVRPGTMATKKTTVKTAATQSDTERFPGLVGKSNIKDVSNIGTIATQTTPSSSSGGYNIKEMDDRLTGVENALGDKADKVDYYTKQEIDDGYYTRQQVEDRLGDIDTSASSQYIQTLAGTVLLHTQQIQVLAAADTGIVDIHTNTTQPVYVETDFDESILDSVNNPTPEPDPETEEG